MGGPTKATELPQVPKENPPVTPTPAIDQTPWRTWLLSRKGWTEFDHDKELSKGWPLVGLPQYTTVIGTSHAWCGMVLATALHAFGYKIPHGAAGAANWIRSGTPIEWKRIGIPRAANVVIRHKDGHYHVTTADRDHTPGETVLEALGGNQNNSVNVTNFNVSGNAHGHDEIVYVGWPVKV